MSEGNKMGVRVKVKIVNIMRRPAFLKGFEDKRAGLGFRDEYGGWGTNPQTSYERGRMLAVCGPKLKTVLTPKGRVSAPALRCYRENNQPEGRVIL